MKKIKLLILAVFFVFCFIFLFTKKLKTSTPNTKPNIIFILSDDQRWDTLGVYGNKDIKTPNIDWLANNGALFNYAYVASPLCCPSRASFLTGFYPHQTGVLTNNKNVKIKDGLKTVADYLNNAGYVTGFIGKAHINGDPRPWGFKETPVFLPMGGSRHNNPFLVIDGKEKEIEGEIKYDSDGDDAVYPKFKNNKNLVMVQGLITEIFTEAVLKFLQENKNKTFFLWIATTAPHLPYYNDPKFIYDFNKLKHPPGFPPQEKLNSFVNWTGYYSTISHLDFNVGKIIEKLKELKLLKNTIIIYAGDNGFMMGSHDLFGKQVWYEESVRVPFLIYWQKKIKPKTIINTPFSGVDLLPTILDIADAQLPKSEGISILPALKIKKGKIRNVVYSEVQQKPLLGGRHWQMIKKNNFKYVWFDDGNEILYDLKTDPQEYKNVVQEKKYNKTLKEMRSLHKNWIGETK